MAQIVHNTAVPNDGLGDALRQAFTDANTMNAELYATKVDKIAGKDLSKNDYTDVDKAKVDAINTDAEENVQSDWNELDPAEDSFILGKPIFSTTQIIVSALWTSGLSFDVIADSFPINGISYPATSGVVTLDTAHATLDRIDLIIATKPVSPATVGTVGKITGIPATTALVVPPDFDPSTQYVIKQVIVRDAATQPEGVSTTPIYTDVTTWSKVLSANIVENTNDPSEGVNCLEATNNVSTDEVIFTAPAPLPTTDIGSLTFDLKLKEAVGSQVIYINFLLAGGLILKYNFATPENGFDSSNLGYQTITILKDKLVLPIQDFDEIIIRPFWASTGYFIDNFVLHTGSGAETVPNGIPEAPNDGLLYGRKNEAWADINSAIFDGLDTTANILAKNPTLFLGQSWFSTDDKIVYKAITSATQSSDNWVGIGVIYDESNDTYKLATTLDGQTQNIGQENFFQGFNDNGAGATALDPKLFLSTGSKVGEENIKNVLLAKASDLQAGSKYGLNTTEAGVGDYTKITTYGDINGVNTSAWLLNAQLYADVVSGELTDVKPSSGIFPVAKVDKVGTTDGILSVNTISAPAGETTAIPTGFDRVHYTADEVTLATGTYFLGKRNDTGIIGLDTTTAICADDTQVAVAQQIVGTPIGFPISFQAGLYTAQVEFQVNGTQGEQRIRIEYYLAAADGTPIDSGILTEAIGVLGVRPALRTISQLLDAAASSPTFAILQGQLAQAVPLGATERVRTVIICEKVGTQGGDLTFTVSVGNLASSFTDTPALFEISDNIDVDTSGGLENNFLKLSASGIWLPTTIAESDLPDTVKQFTYNTISSMISASPSAGDIAITLGYTAINDGGGNIYRIVDDAALIEDFGAIINITGNIYAVAVDTSNLNNRHYGIFSDSVTDWLSAENARYNGLLGAGVLYGVTFESPEGTYFNNSFILTSANSNSRYHFKDAVFSDLVHIVGEDITTGMLTDLILTGHVTTYDRYGTTFARNILGDLNITCKSDIAIHPTASVGRGVHIYHTTKNHHYGSIIIEFAGAAGSQVQAAFAMDGFKTGSTQLAPENHNIDSILVQDTDVRGAQITGIGHNIGIITIDKHGSDIFSDVLGGIGVTSYNGETTAEIAQGVVLYSTDAIVGQITINQKDGFTGRSRATTDVAIGRELTESSPTISQSTTPTIGSIISRNPLRQSLSVGEYQQVSGLTLGSIQTGKISSSNIMELDASGERAIYGLVDCYYGSIDIGRVFCEDPLNVIMLMQRDVYSSGTQRQNVAVNVGILHTPEINGGGYISNDIFQGSINYVLVWNDVNNKGGFHTGTLNIAGLLINNDVTIGGNIFFGVNGNGFLSDDANAAWIGSLNKQNGEGTYYQRSAQVIRTYINGNEESRLSATGLGIGKTATEKLDVAGNALIEGTYQSHKKHRQTSGAFTLALTDRGTILETKTAGVVTIPTNASVAFPIGTEIVLINTDGVTNATFSLTGVTLNDNVGGQILTQYDRRTITKIGTDAWILGN